MKSIKKGLAAALLTGALTTPALADVDLKVLVFLYKDVEIDEYVFVIKEIDIEAYVYRELDNDAEAYAFANVLNIGNFVGRQVRGTNDSTVTREATILSSIGDGTADGDNDGVTQVNQDVGNMVNQGNLAAYGLTGDADAVTVAEASADQINTGNVVAWGQVGDLDPDDPLTAISITALIDGSVIGNDGITQVNQNAGNMNNQTNMLALAAGLESDENGGDEGMVALAEADLGQFNVGNTVVEFNTTKSATMNGSINTNRGVTHVNQAVGNNTNQANLVSVSVNLTGVTP